MSALEVDPRHGDGHGVGQQVVEVVVQQAGGPQGRPLERVGLKCPGVRCPDEGPQQECEEKQRGHQSLRRIGREEAEWKG